jgi:FKBP-type peptidyl-prolyl cis-trans isomerase FkpA
MFYYFSMVGRWTFPLLLAAALAPRPALGEPATKAAAGPEFARLRVGVRDVPAALAWLERVMSWTPAYRSDSRVLYSTAAAPLELDAAPADSSATVVLASRDADADYRRLLERGAESVAAPSDRPSGFREAYVKGPGALLFELDGPLAAPPDFVFTELRAGSGETPGPEDTVKVRYVGTLSDGTVFDGAHRTGRYAMVPLGSAIRCWPQALGRMKAGGRARFVCPPAMAYGRRGLAPKIPPDATLVFDVELVGVLR